MESFEPILFGCGVGLTLEKLFCTASVPTLRVPDELSKHREIHNQPDNERTFLHNEFTVR